MDAGDLCWMDACELEQRYQRREVSPVEVVDALIARIERLNPVLNAFITITADAARTEALDHRDDIGTRRFTACQPFHRPVPVPTPQHVERDGRQDAAEDGHGVEPEGIQGIGHQDQVTVVRI